MSKKSASVKNDIDKEIDILTHIWSLFWRKKVGVNRFYFVLLL